MATPLRYEQVRDTGESDTITGSKGSIKGTVYFGLGGDDTLVHDETTSLSHTLYLGGSGNDTYSVVKVGLMVIDDLAGNADRATATGFGLYTPLSFAATIDGGRHLLLGTATKEGLFISQGILILDWQNPSHRIESVTLSDGTYSFDFLSANLTSLPGWRGDRPWSANGVMFPGATEDSTKEAKLFYTGLTIDLEQPVFAWTNTTTKGSSTAAAPRYAGPVEHLQTQFLDTDNPEAVTGTPFSDFINAFAKDDAISAGAGHDVLDGGTGSNFLTGGTGWDTFFIDGRGGQATWGTITDWEAGEHLSIWGWRPGVSRSTWEASAGTDGYKGATLHMDFDGNGAIDASVTWSGLDRSVLPTPTEMEGLLWFR